MSQPSPPEAPQAEQCSLCGRVAEDVTFDYLGPDHNDPIANERWDYICGPDKGCTDTEDPEVQRRAEEEV